jgi:hypothetical protein
VGNEVSESLSQRCADSCDKVGMKWAFWDAFNGINEEITPPSNIHPFMKMIRLTDHFLTRGEIACALSHISLWVKCVEQDRPLVVLEHDAIMLQKYTEHHVFNSIGYLGGIEQAKKGWKVLPTPPHGSDGANYHFICRAHAYSIDPAVAKNLLAYVLQHGVCTSLDRMIRSDIFPIHQMGLFAYDESNETTINNRAPGDRPSMRNDDLRN